MGRLLFLIVCLASIIQGSWISQNQIQEIAKLLRTLLLHQIQIPALIQPLTMAVTIMAVVLLIQEVMPSSKPHFSIHYYLSVVEVEEVVIG